MYSYCPECQQKLAQAGFAAEIFLMISEFYQSSGDVIALYEPYFTESLRFLELNGYIITTEAYEDLIYAIPRTVALDDGMTVICCAGTCSYSLIDFNDSTA